MSLGSVFHARFAGWTLLAVWLAGGLLGCDEPRPKTRSSAALAGDRSRQASAVLPADYPREALNQLLKAARSREFEAVFTRVHRYRQQVDALRQESPATQPTERVAQFKSAEAAKFARGDVEPDLLELVNLLRPRHQLQVTAASTITDYRQGGVRFAKVVRCEVQIQYESPAEAPFVDGKLLKRSALRILLDEATGAYLTSSRARDADGAWENVPLKIYAVGTQPGPGELTIEVWLMGGRQPAHVCLRNSSCVLWRTTRDGDRLGMLRPVRFVVPARVIEEQWYSPSQWTVAAYDGAGEVQSVTLTGMRWQPPQMRANSENRVWWIAEPWYTAGPWNPLSGVYEAQLRELLLPFKTLSATEHDLLILAINKENQAQARQRAAMKVEREPGRTITHFAASPDGWSIPFTVPANVMKWELDTGGKRVEVLLSNGERFGVGNSGQINVPPNGSVHFRSLETEPVPARFILTLSGE